MSQEVAAVTAAKYVNEVTVDGVTRYQACVHWCSSDIRDTHHEAVKDARRMLQSATVTAVMKGDTPKLPAAAAYDISGAWIVAKAVRERGEVIAVDYFANPLNRSAKAIESWTGEDADEIIRGALAGNVVRVESRGLAKPETRDLVAVIAPSREAAVMTARVKLGSAEEKLTAERDEARADAEALRVELDDVRLERDAAVESRKRRTDAIRRARDRAGVSPGAHFTDDLDNILARMATLKRERDEARGESQKLLILQRERFDHDRQVIIAERDGAAEALTQVIEKHDAMRTRADEMLTAVQNLGTLRTKADARCDRLIGIVERLVASDAKRD